MLSHLIPEDRHLRRALAGLLAFVILSLAAGGVAAWDAYSQGELGREHDDIAQIVWQYGLGSPEAAMAIEHTAQQSRPYELVALLDPATGKATAAWPAKYTGEGPEHMVLDSGVKLPGLQMVKGYRSFRLRRFAPTQSGASTGLVATLRSRMKRENWVKVRLSPLYPWRSERSEFRKSARIRTLSLAATTPTTTGVSPEATSERDDDDRNEEFAQHSQQMASAPPIGYLLVISSPRLITPLGISARLVGSLAAVGLLVYWLSVAWWVFLDARRRGNRPFAWGMLVLLTNLVGVAVYLTARRQWLQCTNCGGEVDKRLRYCPWCGRALMTVCAKCDQPLQRGWTHCASCGTVAT